MGGTAAASRLAVVALLTVGIGAAGGSPAIGARSHSLAAKQVHRIVKMTGYRGLRSHRFVVANAFRSNGTSTVVVRLDNARPAVGLPELRRDLSLAARLAAGRPTFTSRIRLGSGARQHITFHVAPADVLTPHEPYVRYVIFSRRNEPLTKLTRPQHVPAIQALTVIDAAHRINVTLQQDRAKGATWGPGIPAARLFTMVESLNTSSYVFLTSTMTGRIARHHADPNQVLAMGREIWSNSLAFAISAARKGMSYRAYARHAHRLRFNIYQRNDLRYLTVPAAQYRRFG